MNANDYLQRELDARDAEIRAAKALIDGAETETRDLSEDESRTFNALEGSIATRKARIAGLTRMVQAGGVLDRPEIRSVVQGASSLPGTGIEGTNTVNDPIRAMINAGERLQDFPVDALTRGSARFVSGEETRAITTTSTGSPSAIAPVDFSTRVAIYARTLSPWLGLATVINSNEGRDLVLPNLTADQTTYSPGEGSAVTPADPTLGHVTITLKSYKTLTLVSNEAIEDEAVNLTDLLAFEQARSIGLSFGTDATAAILVAATNAGTASGTPFFTLDDLITTEYTAAAAYRAEASWVMANSAISKVAKFKDSQGQYLWNPTAQAGQPRDLLGGVVYEDPALATVASATKSVLYVSGPRLVIKASPIRTEISRDYAFNTDQTAVKTVWRLGIGVPDALAVRYLVSGNS